MLEQGRQSYDFGAVIRPHSQWQKVSFFPIYQSKFPKIVQSEKSDCLCVTSMKYIYKLLLSINSLQHQ